MLFNDPIILGIWTKTLVTIIVVAAGFAICWFGHRARVEKAKDPTYAEINFKKIDLHAKIQSASVGTVIILFGAVVVLAGGITKPFHRRRRWPR